MKNYLTILLMLFLVACGGNASAPSATETATINGEGITKTPVAGKNGLEKVIKKNKQDKVLEEGFLLNGVKHGTWLEYHTNRNDLVKSITNYENGVKQGAALKIGDTGSVTTKMFYIDGNLDGDYVKFNRTRIKETATYKNNQLHGKRTVFYDDGKTIQEEGEFVNGKRDGIAKWYDQEGNTTIEYTYKNGEKVE